MEEIDETNDTDTSTTLTFDKNATVKIKWVVWPPTFAGEYNFSNFDDELYKILEEENGV